MARLACCEPRHLIYIERTIMEKGIPDVLTINDLQSILGIGRSTAYELANSGALRTMRFGKLIRIRREDFVDYLEEKCHNHA